MCARTAHMDGIGLIMEDVTKEGSLQFAEIGGIDDHILVRAQ